MNKINLNPAPIKLIAALLFKDQVKLDQALKLLRTTFSPTDYISLPYDFTQSDYYNQEMGAGLKKIIVSFQKPNSPEFLASSKIITAEFEDALSQDGNRTVNIDMGYLDLFKVVLASFKARNNKIYLTRGVWADMVLYFESGEFRPFAWSFPDFKSGVFNQDLKTIRNIFKNQLRDLSK